MNKLRQPLSLGSPYHGLTYNDVYELGPHGLQRIAQRPAGATFGPCIPIRHPLAPGAQPWQDANDYRNWGQYVGHTRSINGIDGGVGIGWNRWLYCDPVSGAVWMMRVTHTVNAASVDFGVWLDGLFGRIGRQYPVLPQLLATYNWTPDIPSWNVGWEVEWIVSETMWGGHFQLAIKDDGSQVYFHIYTSPGGVSARDYVATSETGHSWGLLSGAAMAGILRIDVAGSSQPAEAGNGITCSITQDLAYEGGIVSSFDYDGEDRNHQALLYKSPHGTVERTWSYNMLSGAFAVSLSAFGVVINESGATPSPETSSGNEVVIFAQNAVYFATYKSGAPYNFFREVWIGQDYLHAGVAFDDHTTLSTWETPSSGNHEMPYARRQVCSFNLAQPGDHVVAVNTYLQPYDGNVYQYF